MRPSHVHQKYGEALGVSLSAVFRHSRGHVRSSLVPVFLGDHTRGETVADLAALARSLYRQHVDARESGQAAASARFGGEARQAFSALLAVDVDSERAVEMAGYAEQLGQVFGALLWEHRDLLPLAAEIARRDGHALALQELETDLPATFAAWDRQEGTEQ